MRKAAAFQLFSVSLLGPLFGTALYNCDALDASAQSSAKKASMSSGAKTARRFA